MSKKALRGRSLLYFLLVILLAIDISYSFMQYLHTPLDGDLAGGVLPTSYDVQQIFDDPFGFKVISESASHPNPNRYFAHLIFRDYFQNIPFLLQRIFSPIESIYFANAIIKIFVHLLLIYLLASLISQSISILNKRWWIAAILVTPLFQAYGYSHYMGIIDNSITYFFFYALPLSLIFLFYWHFYKIIYHQQKSNFSIFSKLLLTVLAISLPLSGPLIPGIALIVSLLTGIYYYQKLNLKKLITTPTQLIGSFINGVPNSVLIFFSIISFVSLYSIWLGSYNSNFQEGIPTIAERYSRLPKGIYYQFTQKLGFPILFILLIINSLLIKKYAFQKNGKKIIHSFKWIALFAILFILLLPLGGYRPYRPNILRFDVIAPITICLIYWYGISTYYLLHQLPKYKIGYTILTVIFLFIFTNSDISNLNENSCEKQALQVIANSKQTITPLKINCEVMSWGLISDPQKSGLNADVLQFWGITKERKLYFHQTTEK